MLHFSLMNVEFQSSWLDNFSLNFWTSKLLHSADSWQNVVVMFVVRRTKMGNRQKLPASTDLVPSLTIRQCCSSVSLGQVKRTKWKMMASISFIMRLALQWPVTRNTPNIFFFMFIGHCLIVVVVATGIFFFKEFLSDSFVTPQKTRKLQFGWSVKDIRGEQMIADTVGWQADQKVSHSHWMQRYKSNK